MREGRRQIWERFVQRKREPGNASLFLAGTAACPGVRSSRRVCGLATATAADAWEFNKYPDGIARTSWEIDIHPADRPTGKGVEFESEAYQPRMRRAERGDWFDIRYGCLVARDIDNLLVAGRCLSAEHEAQASLRIQQTCMSTGQAAGTAAALSLQAGLTPRELDPAGLVAQLGEDREVEAGFGILSELAGRQGAKNF